MIFYRTAYCIFCQCYIIANINIVQSWKKIVNMVQTAFFPNKNFKLREQNCNLI
jgi:hypothetical protein